jgi:hypothetical protein
MVLPRFLTELKRRNVYRAALVYAAVGWLILEAADVVLPRLGLPDWTVNAVLAVVLLGLPNLFPWMPTTKSRLPVSLSLSLFAYWLRRSVTFMWSGLRCRKGW